MNTTNEHVPNSFKMTAEGVVTFDFAMWPPKEEDDAKHTG